MGDYDNPSGGSLKKSVNFFGITVSIFYFWGADVS
jgi:hypothetical protein